MLKVQLSFQLLSQQDVTKKKSPSGSFSFLTHPLPAAAKSS